MRLKFWLSCMLVFLSPSLYAHTGALLESGLASGLLHPLTGIDHLLVLAAIGLMAVQQQGRISYLLPLIFMALVGVGIFAGFSGINFVFNEVMIALSVIVFGVALNFDKAKVGRSIGVGLSVFAVFHGYAHAAEIPGNVDVTQYLSGLMLASLAIIIGSGLIGCYVGKSYGHVLSVVCLGSGLYYLAAI